MDVNELRKLRRSVKPFVDSVMNSPGDLDSDDACDRYHELYDMVEAASQDPNFKRYVPPITSWASGPGRQPLSRQYARLILTSAEQLFAYLDDAIGPEERPMDNLTQKKEQRYLFLKRLYEDSKGNEHKFLTTNSLGAALGFDSLTLRTTVQYLEGEGLVRVTSEGQVVSITHAGIVEYEEGQKNPNRATTHFLPFATMQIVINGSTFNGDFNVGSVIQDSYNTAAAADAPEELKDLLKQLSTEVSNISAKLPPEVAEEAARDLNTLTTEATSKSPRKAHVQISAEGLIKAANIIGAIGVPVVTLAGRIVEVVQTVAK